MLGFFSGFPTRQFSTAIAEQLKKELPVRDSLVFISAWPADYARNDSDAAGMHAMFANCAMPFASYSVIDNRTSAACARQLIREASCLFLMGGHATQQFRLICEKDIRHDICESSAVILGVSAGSINMAARALDIWESPVPYEGLGLANITIKAHVTLENQELLKTLLIISAKHNMPICAMEDESAIFVKEKVVAHMGKIHWINEGGICPFSPELLMLS